MVNSLLGARSPKGTVGVRGVVDAGELSAYSQGVLSGFAATSAASLTLQLGGTSGTQDVAVAKNPGGESELLVSTAGQSLAFIIGSAPGTAGQSRTDALVAWKDVSVTSAVNDGIDAVFYQVVPGTAATTGTQVPPSLATIRSTIANGTLAFVAILGYVTIANGASSITTGNFFKYPALVSTQVVADVTSRNLLTPIEGQRCYQIDNDMYQVYDGSAWCNIPRLLKRVTLTVAGDTISVTGIPLRDNLQMKAFCKNSGSIKPELRFNNDSAAHYSAQISASGGAWSVVVSQTTLPINPTPGSEAYSCIVTSDINNSATDFKLVKADSYDAFGTDATSSLNFAEYRQKWASTSQVTRVDVLNTGTGDFAIGSYVEIYG